MQHRLAHRLLGFMLCCCTLCSCESFLQLDDSLLNEVKRAAWRNPQDPHLKEAAAVLERLDQRDLYVWVAEATLPAEVRNLLVLGSRRLFSGCRCQGTPSTQALRYVLGCGGHTACLSRKLPEVCLGVWFFAAGAAGKEQQADMPLLNPCYTLLHTEGACQPHRLRHHSWA